MNLFSSSRLVLSVVALTAACVLAPSAQAASTTPAPNAGPAGGAPLVPFSVDGVEYALSDIHRFDGTPLYISVLGPSPGAPLGSAQAFTDPAEFDRVTGNLLTAARDPATAADASDSGPTVAGAQTWEHALSPTSAQRGKGISLPP